MWRRADRQRKYLLHFLASTLLFTPPILPPGMAEAIRQQIIDIAQGWRWQG